MKLQQHLARHAHFKVWHIEHNFVNLCLDVLLIVVIVNVCVYSKSSVINLIYSDNKSFPIRMSPSLASTPSIIAANVTSTNKR